ncbi:hypothetical protein EJB05_30550, partial [Eragrostis curvula]
MGGVLASTMGELTGGGGGLVAQEAAEEVGVEVTEVINEGVGDGGGPEVEPEERESKDEGEEEDDDEDEGEEEEATDLQCSICLDEVLLGSGNRSTANLRCGHQFHLVLDGQNINAEPISLSEHDTSLLSAYFAYLNPSAPPGLSSSFLVVERAVDGSAHHDHWNPIAGPSNGQPLQTLQPIEFHDNLSAHMPPEQQRLPMLAFQAERPRIPGVPPADGPAVVSLPDNPFYLFPPASSGSRSEEAAESGGGNRFDSWNQGHFGPHSPVNNEGVWPSSSHQLTPLYAARRLFGLADSGSSPQPENSSADDESFHQMHFPDDGNPCGSHEKQGGMVKYRIL